MKKALSIILFVFMCGVTRAQVQLGVRAGANIATTKNLTAFPENRLGWYGGLKANIPLSTNFFLMPELIYSSKGYSTDNQGVTERFRYKINYLNLPVMLGYSFDSRSSILFGAEIGYFLNARGKSRNYNYDATKNFAPDFDASIGIGLEHAISRRIGVEARYNYGFRTLYKIDGAGVPHKEFKGGHRVFQTGIYYFFF